MKKEKTRRPVASIDMDSLIMLHQEAADHLEMMHHLAESEEYLSGPNRNEIGRMIEEHWATYMNIMHMICHQDHMMESAMEECDMDMRKEPKDIPEDAERQFGFFRFPIFPLLLFSLAFRHRRRRNFFEHFFRRDQFESYLHSTSRMECDHIASLTSMVEDMM
jgi:hypothetical protein